MSKRLRIPMLLGALAACNGATAPEEGFERLPADNVMTDVQTRYTATGIVSAEAQFDTVYTFEDSAIARVHGVRIQLFDRVGRQTGTLTADSGRTNQNTEEMVAWGSVVLIALEDGRKIETQELFYDPQNRRIWSDVHTVQTLKGEVTEGLGGFQADDQFRNVQIIRPRGRLPGVRVEF